MILCQLIYEKLGDVLVVDVGGATTDVYSVTEGTETVAKIQIAPEALAKRTVEGDLGMYVNMEHVIEIVGEEQLMMEGHDLDKIRESYHSIPRNNAERTFIERLAEVAVKTAVDRHVGTIRYVYGPSGRDTLAQGKDLSNIRYVIGTGGALIHLKNGVDILSRIRKDECSDTRLLPTGQPEVLIDHDYIMSSLGVLSTKYEEAALKLLEQSLGISLSFELEKAQ